MNAITLVNILIYLQSVVGRDYYLGMFKRDDFLVAQDTIFKQKRPYAYVRADYGRLFKCPITYFRIVDRLGMGVGPTVQVTRGGLLKKFITIRITSQYNLPISVNIYVGCENKQPRKPIKAQRPVPKRINKTTTTTTTGTTTLLNTMSETGNTDKSTNVDDATKETGETGEEGTEVTGTAGTGVTEGGDTVTNAEEEGESTAAPE